MTDLLLHQDDRVVLAEVASRAPYSCEIVWRDESVPVLHATGFRFTVQADGTTECGGGWTPVIADGVIVGFSKGE